MTVHAVRIVKAKHATTAFTGEGARRFGGRWNSPGSPMVYLAGSTSLAILEMLVHLAAPDLMKHYVLFDVAFDETLVGALDAALLPRNWLRSPPPPALQRLGDAWLAGRASAVWRVPSAIVPSESNYLLNPMHPDFPGIRIGARRKIRFDPRLIK